MKYRQLLYGHPVPQSFFDAMQEFMSALSANFVLSLAPGTANQVQVLAGSGNAQAAIGIDGLWRYNSQTVTVAVTGAAGTYDLYACCQENDFSTNLEPPPAPPEIDSTDYSFELASVAAGQTPQGYPHMRKVGQAVTDGSSILVLLQTAGPTVPTVVGGTQQAPGGVIVGEPHAWLLPNLPYGYIEFAGQSITAPQYPRLFALFGATMPDLRGCMLLGSDSAHAIGTRGGEFSHLLSNGEMPVHSHGGAVGGSNANVSVAGAYTGISIQQVDASGSLVNFGRAWGFPGLNSAGDIVSAGVAGGTTDTVPRAATYGDNNWGRATMVHGHGVNDGGHGHNVNQSAHGHTISNDGGNIAHNNLPPYQTVRWITLAA